MNQKEIEKKISDEMEAYNNAVCVLKIPQNILLFFKRAVMSVKMIDMKLSARFLVDVSSKNIDELTNIQVRIMVNTIVNVSPDILFKDYVSYERGIPALEKLIMETNMETRRVQSELDAKKSAMMNLAGLGAKKLSIIQ